jgi:hypothetical protein
MTVGIDGGFIRAALEDRFCEVMQVFIRSDFYLATLRHADFLNCHASDREALARQTERFLRDLRSSAAT